jgi:hypothetical protein
MCGSSLYADCYMRVRVLHAKLYAKLYANLYAKLYATARQLDSSTGLTSSTATRQLDRPRQLLDTPAARRMESASTSLDRLDRIELDRNSTGSTGKASTAPRQRLDGASTAQLSSTARAQVSQRSPPACPWPVSFSHFTFRKVLRSISLLL